MAKSRPAAAAATSLAVTRRVSRATPHGDDDVREHVGEVEAGGIQAPRL
jgi:hypothetical protein